MTREDLPEMTPAEGAAAQLVTTLSNGTKVKRRLLRMRACNERNAKGKTCSGHLKRWYLPFRPLNRSLESHP